MQVERESGGDLARAFDEDEDDRVVTILFLTLVDVVELPFARVERMVKISNKNSLLFIRGILKSHHK